MEKSSERKGIFRKREYRFLAGEKKYTTVHREYGLQFKVNPTEVYFSPRELTERQRIAAQVKPKETVMVMFSGVGPYGLAIAKKQPLVNQVICIEMNPKAAKYARENIRLNRLYGKVVHLTGDVKKKSEKCLKGFVPKGCPEYHELTDDPYDNLVDEEPEIRNCVVSFEQVCLIGNFSELYDCPENSDEYKFNLNNPENIYNGIC